MLKWEGIVFSRLPEFYALADYIDRFEGTTVLP